LRKHSEGREGRGRGTKKWELCGDDEEEEDGGGSEEMKNKYANYVSSDYERGGLFAEFSTKRREIFGNSNLAIVGINPNAQLV
jgi:hypothetical protein